jgi:4-carboxymuconolactone decarboxylase
MRSTLLAGCAIVFAGVLGHTLAAQAPSPARREGPPTIEQARQAVAALRGNRIAIPANYDSLTAAQQAYVQSILTGPRANIPAPLGVMMVSPELGDLAQKATAYARFAGEPGFAAVPPKLNELAILIVAKHWSAEYVWNAHHAYAVKMGLPAALVEAIRAGAPPPPMEPDVEAIYTFATEFIATRNVSDAAVQSARAVLGGDRGLVDLVGTMGLYQISSMMVALDQSPLGRDAKPYFAR